MNKSFKHLSLIIALSLLFGSVNIHCMHVKKLTKISASYSLRQKSTPNKTNPDELESKIAQLNTKLDKIELDLLDIHKQYIQKRLDANEKYLSAAKKSLDTQVLEANINTSAITNKIQSTKLSNDDSVDEEEDPYLSGRLSFKSPEKAAEALTSQYDHTRDSALHFFMKRIKKKKNLPLIAHIAEQTFNAPEGVFTLGHTKEVALQIFTALAQEDYVHDTALQAATTGMLTKGWGHVRLAGRDLFEALLQKDHPHTVEIATQAAINVFLEQDWRTIYNGLQLFKIMFSHGKGFEEATQFAEHISQHKDWELRKSALQLLQALVEHDQAIDLAEKTAMQHIKDFSVPTVQAQAFLLLIHLVKKDYAIESAKHAITFVSSSNQYLEDNPMCFYKELSLLCSEKNKPAWRQLDIHVCSYDIPIARPDDGKPDNPKYVLRPGEEKKLTQAMCDLMRGNREAGLTPFEDQGIANNENTNISPSPCTSKALMCIADSEQPQKKKRLLKDELKYPEGQPMGGDELKYSVTAKEFAAMLPEFEKQHWANVDKCGKE